MWTIWDDITEEGNKWLLAKKIRILRILGGLGKMVWRSGQGAYSSLMSYVRHKNFRTITFVRRLRRIHKSVRKLFCVSYVRIRMYESFQAKLYVSIK